jgi:hypothetical protein
MRAAQGKSLRACLRSEKRVELVVRLQERKLGIRSLRHAQPAARVSGAATQRKGATKRPATPRPRVALCRGSSAAHRCSNTCPLAATKAAVLICATQARAAPREPRQGGIGRTRAQCGRAAGRKQRAQAGGTHDCVALRFRRHRRLRGLRHCGERAEQGGAAANTAMQSGARSCRESGKVRAPPGGCRKGRGLCCAELAGGAGLGPHACRRARSPPRLLKQRSRHAALSPLHAAARDAGASARDDGRRRSDCSRRLLCSELGGPDHASRQKVPAPCRRRVLIPRCRACSAARLRDCCRTGSASSTAAPRVQRLPRALWPWSSPARLRHVDAKACAPHATQAASRTRTR